MGSPMTQPQYGGKVTKKFHTPKWSGVNGLIHDSAEYGRKVTKNFRTRKWSGVNGFAHDSATIWQKSDEKNPNYKESGVDGLISTLQSCRRWLLGGGVV